MLKFSSKASGTNYDPVDIKSSLINSAMQDVTSLNQCFFGKLQPMMNASHSSIHLLMSS